MGSRAWVPKQPTIGRGRGSWRHPPSQVEFWKLLGMKTDIQGHRRAPVGLGGGDWDSGEDSRPLGSVTSGPRRRSAKLCTVSSGSLPWGAVRSLSPAQSSGLEKGGEARSSPLRRRRSEGGRWGPPPSNLCHPLARSLGGAQLGAGTGGASPEAGGQRVQGTAHVQEPVAGSRVVSSDR